MNRTPLQLKFYALVLMLTIVCSGLKAQSLSTDTSDELAAYAMMLDSFEKIDKTIPYKHGKVAVNNFLTLNVPPGYKFIPDSSAKMIVTDLWKNPKDESILGMVVPNDFSLSNMESWAFIVSYEESGYVKDEDAEDIDYDQMMKDIQSSEPESNAERVKQGYSELHILGWAAKPYYDKDRKILHWAKKIQVGNEATADEDLTLNYEVRMLGRKGVLSMNAVGSMYQLDTINKHIPDVLNIASFNDGFAYKDFNPSMDKVAAYTVGGLIAGKLIAKTGLLILLLKNIKLILLACFGFFGAFRKKIANFFSRKKNDEEMNLTPAYLQTTDEESASIIETHINQDVDTPAEQPDVPDNQSSEESSNPADKV